MAWALSDQTCALIILQAAEGLRLRLAPARPAAGDLAPALTKSLHGTLKAKGQPRRIGLSA